MASIPNRLRRAIFSPATKDDLIRLATINHPDWDEPLRFCNLGLEFEVLETGIRRFTVSDGLAYDEAIVSARSGDDVEDDLPSSQLLLDNVQYRTGDLLEEDLRKITIDQTLVSKEDPDEVAEEIEDWGVSSGEATMEVTALDVALDSGDKDEPAVAYTMNKQNARGLFL